MISSILPVALLALQSASFALGGVIQARGDLPTPTPKEMRERMKEWDSDDYEYVFYLGKESQGVAESWSEDRGLGTMTLWETDRQLKDETLWYDPNKAWRLWNEVFTEQARGTAFVFWTDSGKIPRIDSWFFQIELPILKERAKGPGHDLEELIQINARNVKEIHQILPVDVNDYKDKQCAWHGTAPECDAKCPDGTKKITESKYGDDIDGKCEEEGRKVFCCKKD
ncbi:uncharacterized protein BKCO1_680009 [Diplodia corticola]|uniref:Uncharacterized protein n=1 Tax=Diplodia corticola TaxID=236234 RepID=A0A1J9RNC3_9PEZI|nr:uncharacterized protein BKCO1_680009 [Diplodia corticola]OJD29991.1 hypothetical protein BKCO1_680009 [Diplodia corticola]